jgi:hypothetical protein
MPLRTVLKWVSKKILAVAVASTVTMDGTFGKVVSEIVESLRNTDSAELGRTRNVFFVVGELAGLPVSFGDVVWLSDVGAVETGFLAGEELLLLM